MTEEKPHILIVDDDTRILKLLKQFLVSSGYYVSVAESVIEAEKYMEYFIFDLLILDVMLPGVTGIEFAASIKSNKVHVPIILLTALSEVEDRVRGLESGADDYMSKPFDPRELLLRTKNLIEIYGYNKKLGETLSFGDSIYNMNTKEFTKNGENISLSSTEQKLLEILIECNKKPISREELSKKMGGLNERSIDVQIVRLRSKIENDKGKPKYLQTIRNEGYVLYS
ncbi:MAG: response regulator transcription factor [Rickettsiaceae bacterium]|nr:response regulator transcription factor [Rickettsiaceae bacterium]